MKTQGFSVNGRILWTAFWLAVICNFIAAIWTAVAAWFMYGGWESPNFWPFIGWIVGISFVTSFPGFYHSVDAEMNGYLPTGLVSGIILTLLMGLYCWLISPGANPNPVVTGQWIGGISVGCALLALRKK